MCYGILAAIDTTADCVFGQLFLAGALALIAVITFISGFPTHRRATAGWKGGWRRTLFGTIAFSTGAGLLCMGLLLHTAITGPPNPFRGIELWFLYPGAALFFLTRIIDPLIGGRSR